MNKYEFKFSSVVEVEAHNMQEATEKIKHRMELIRRYTDKQLWIDMAVENGKVYSWIKEEDEDVPDNKL